MSSVLIVGEVSSATTEDAVLGGRLLLRQPRRGHRVGHDAILLAAATPARSGNRAVDLGAGVGAAGLALATRVEGVTVTLVEIDAGLVALARENIALNGLEDRAVALTLAVAHAVEAPGLARASFDVVLMNPPFRDPARAQASPVGARRQAHVATAGTLGLWLEVANALLKPRGRLALIWEADGLMEVLETLTRRFGSPAVLPVHPKPDANAIRVLVTAAKGGRAPLQILPGLVLNDAHGRPSAAAEAVLREGAPLPLART